uniref:Uncharacterized protein n=1 Tax=Arundo donax TaxID=35708 RepID=A0A0A9B053_ARUDO
MELPGHPSRRMCHHLCAVCRTTASPRGLAVVGRTAVG